MKMRAKPHPECHRSPVIEMREIAERVLFADTLEEKLRLGPIISGDDAPGPAIALPDAPGRPPELRVRADGVRVDFPGIHRLDDDRERGVMLHFLANHELLAAELMALVLLRFPDAPREYRAGVYEAMREEQAHALMYVRRMRECGIAFGELPVNDHFWRIVAPMATPLDFVTRLNLTFEQANLDFSKHYATLFRRVGDDSTAAVLEKIHLDEIGHVGHGLKWFRRWKDQGESDWQAFRRCLSFPLTPARAKGIAPFNAESRRLAGLDDDFIRNLEVCEHSRGRTPVVHWFNPNAESHARSAQTGRPWQADKTSLDLEADLEALILGCCRRDDAALLRHAPSVDHLSRLKQAGFEIPEILTEESLAGRKLGGLRPWAWSPDASEFFKPHAAAISPAMDHPWREPLPAAWFSKEIGLLLETSLGPVPETGRLFRDSDATVDEIDRLLDIGQVLLKAPFSHAGRGHLRVNDASDPQRTRGWIANTLAGHGGVVVEPWLDRLLDFSALYEMHPGGRVSLLDLTHLENDAAGRFLGIRVGPKWGSLLPPDLAALLYGPARVMQVYQDEIPALLPGLLPGYTGPLCVDALVHRRADGTPALKPVVELNVRMTMGRIAWEWMKRQPKPSAGRLRILRRASLTAEDLGRISAGPGVFLNDPQSARTFIAHWQAC
jgi:uncharacterized ferritin-like protein (DUF455 family)